MAHITEFIINGLMGRTNPIHMVLNRHVNIFFGENGCGKTTLLKVLDAALSRDAAAMATLPVEKAEVHIYSITEKRTFKHTWSRGDKSKAATDFQRQLMVVDGREAEFILDADAWTNSVATWKLQPSYKGKSPNQRWAHTFLPTTRLYLNDARSRSIDRPVQKTEKQLDEAFAESANRAWLQFYSNTVTQVREIQEEGLRAVLQHVLNPTPYTYDFSEHTTEEIYHLVSRFLKRQSKKILSIGSLATFNERYSGDGNLRQIVDNLANVERRIEEAMLPIDQFTKVVNGLFSRGKKINLKNEMTITLDNGTSISINQLSAGEKHLIKILLAAMSSRENSILIDEPELSLHIDWQKNFVSTVQALNPSCQLLLASHSPEIMADVPDECIFKL